MTTSVSAQELAETSILPNVTRTEATQLPTTTQVCGTGTAPNNSPTTSSTDAVPQNPAFDRQKQSIDPATYPLNCDFSTGRQTLAVAVSPDQYNLIGDSNATSQAFDVPVEVQSLRLSYQAGDSRNSSTALPIWVDVLSGPNFATITRIDSDLLTGAVNDGWKAAVLDVQRFQGQTIKLRVRAWNQWYGLARIDQLSLNTETLGWTSSSASFVQAVNDANNPHECYW